MNKKTILLSLTSILGTFCASTSGQATFDLNNLTYYGTGPDRAAFVIDWNNGSANEVVAWGYNFDETSMVTMEQMMAEIASDPNSELFIRWDSDAGFGAFMFGLGKQNGGTAFSVSNAVDADNNPVASDFQNGVWDIDSTTGFDSPAQFTGVATNAGDFYHEGFEWSSYLAGSSNITSAQRLVSPADWSLSFVGISNENSDGSVNNPSAFLVNEGWYGFGNGRAPNTVPEPNSFALIFSLAALFSVVRRRR